MSERYNNPDDAGVFEDDPTITVCRSVAGEHVGGPSCWCRPVTMTVSEWDRYMKDHPPNDNGEFLGLDS